MDKIRTIIATLLLFLSTTSFVGAFDWYLFESSDFSVEFPHEPTTTAQLVNTAIGEMTMKITMYDASKDGDENLVYGLVTSEYPDSLIKSSTKETIDELFRRSIDGAVTNVKGTLLTEKKIELDGFPGRETRADFQNGLAIIKMRMYLVKNKMFLMQTITETSKENNSNSLKFLNSLKLKK
jgi:hypothetical protein